MQLTDELFERGKNQKEICTIIDDDYVLLHKTMPCSDQELDSYINQMKQAKNDGLNISCITDYRLRPETTHTFGNVAFTKGVFVEQRAKGITNSEDTCLFLNAQKEYDYDALAYNYLTTLTNYIQSLEYKDSAPQEVYDKLLADMLGLQKYNLTIDPKPLNFFFDKDAGYTIIDPIPSNNKTIQDLEYYPHYFMLIIFGYGCPYISGNDSKRLIPEDLLIRFQRVISSLMNKATTSLKKYGFEDKDINDSINKTNKMTLSNIEIVDRNNLSGAIKDLHAKQKSL